MSPTVHEVHYTILNMTLALRRANRLTTLEVEPDPTLDFAPAPWRERAEPVWWVLVCGEPLDPYSIERRDQARERLRRLLTEHGIHLDEHVWVWDSTGVAQVVAGEYASRQAAEERAQELRALGLRVRVRLEVRED